MPPHLSRRRRRQRECAQARGAQCACAERRATWPAAARKCPGKRPPHRRSEPPGSDVRLLRGAAPASTMLKKFDKKDEESAVAKAAPPVSCGSRTLAFVHSPARVFNETPINPRKCAHILTKILYLINQGEHLGTTEATEAFFAMTKLFQSNDPTLRRMCYLTIKEMSCIAEDVIIVTSRQVPGGRAALCPLFCSLTKDMTGKEDNYRGPAVRALCQITDSTMLQAIERYMKQAIVDKVPSVSSSALVSSLHLLKCSFDVVKRWVNEAQEAASSDNIMVQYHALGLLYHVRKNDRLAVNKMLSKFTRHGLKSPFAYCMMIRVASKQLEEEDGSRDSPLFDFIESCLRNKHEMVVYEAASAIVNLPGCSAKELAPAVSVLQLFCSSPKAALRYAAVRTLNKVAMKHPSAVTACNLDLENLVTDSNRSIATLAITTLLKTGSESSIDRLMKQISSFMSEISDEFKVVVVQAISALCQKYPRKHAVLMNFLFTMLREEGGFEYKRAIVDCIISIIEENAESKETGLSHLCEFIEDCEFTVLATRILHLLGQEGPKTNNPSKYIRFIYNRVVLEHEEVRAGAVSALAKFGAQNEEMLPSILVLLKRCVMDDDNEVRDRATFYLNVLEQKQKALNAGYILNGLTVSIPGLERALQQYTLEPSEKPFDLKSVPLATTPMAEQRMETTPISAVRQPEKVAATRQEIFQEQLAAVPEFHGLGPLFKSSSEPVALTESETEYVIRCTKHTFTEHMVFQFDCTNTLNDQTLENVTVQMEPTEAYEVLCYVPARTLPYNQPGTCYTLVALPREDPTAVACTFSCMMKFTVKDCDPTTGETDEEGYEDEYVLEDLEVTVADHIQKVMKLNFEAAWDEVGDEFEKEETFTLSTIKTLEEAVGNIVKFLGMHPCERSDRVPDNKNTHTLLLAGVFRGGHDVLVRSRLLLLDTVTMQVTARSSEELPVDIILASVG
ncbi:Coatomer subunit gamma-1 [Sciurus carolinensis]|uniref:Coatomer subunit gamma n=1 Tax=Sciurus carolinensis TaxID=30640 RepID=A0AA41T5D1_SCICA|nr:Coatomer subunit gamma-1 [Sciurus carolinensis]